MIFVGDLHLGRTNDSYLKDGVPVQVYDTLNRLNLLLEKSQGKHGLFILGDVFDKVNPNTEIIHYFFKFLQKCRDYGIPVYLIPGNHDSSSKFVNLFMLKELKVDQIYSIVEPGIYTVQDSTGSIDAFILPNVPISMRGSVEYRDKKARYLFGHGMVESVSYSTDIFFEAGNAMVIDIEKQFPSVQKAILGHIHTFYTGSKGKWVYPGSVICNTFGEISEKKGFIVWDLSKDDFNWEEFLKDSATPWKQVFLDFTKESEDSLDWEKLKEEYKGSILKIIVKAKSNTLVNEVKLRQLFGEFCYVSRFSLEIEGQEAIKISNKGIDHFVLLKEYVDKTDSEKIVKDLALEIGKQVLEEVSHD